MKSPRPALPLYIDTNIDTNLRFTVLKITRSSTGLKNTVVYQCLNNKRFPENIIKARNKAKIAQ